MNENGEMFKKELEELCKKYNVTLFAGYRGIMFDFHNKEDENKLDGYYNQNATTKEFFEN